VLRGPDYETATAEEFIADGKRALVGRRLVDIIVPTRARRVGFSTTDGGAK